MEVLIVTRNLVSFGGIPYSLLNLLKGQKLSGDNFIRFKFLVIDKKDSELIHKELIKSGGDVSYDPIVQMYKYSRSNKPNNTIVIGTCFKSFLISKLVFRNFKVLLWLRGPGILKSPLKSFIYNKICGHKALVNSRFTGLINGLDDNSFKIIHNGIDRNFLELDSTDFHSRFNVENSSYVIGYIGGWSQIKNHIVLIKAFEIVLKDYPNAFLLLIGETSERTEQALSLISSSTLERIHIGGKIGFASKYLRKMDLYVHPCYAEGFGNSLVECIFSETPFLAANAGAFPEYINSSCLFAHDDEAGLAEMIKKYLDACESKQRAEYPIEYFESTSFYLRFKEIIKNI